MSKFRFTIGRRIGLGFAIFILLTVIAFVLTVVTLNDSKRRTETVVGQVTPSVAELKELNLLLQRSQTDISKWYYNKSVNDKGFRDDLKKILEKEFPSRKTKLSEFSRLWSSQEKEQLKVIFIRIERLFDTYQHEIMDQLKTLEDYDDPTIYLMAQIPFEETETSIIELYKSLDALILL